MSNAAALSMCVFNEVARTKICDRYGQVLWRFRKPTEVVMTGNSQLQKDVLAELAWGPTVDAASAPGVTQVLDEISMPA